MSDPVIAAKRPAVLELAAGTYYYCRCGLAKDQPFCDGSHKGTAFSPMEFSLSEAKRVLLCQCKRTATPPFCDGMHKHI